MPTIHDVARRAGVSAMTVSRVINGTHYVSEETRRSVDMAIADLGYVLNGVASNLRSKRTKTIALIVADITNPFFTTVARGVEDAAASRGYGVMFANTDESELEEIEYMRMLARRQIDGILLVPAGQSPDTLRLIRSQRIPAVLLDRRVSTSGLDVVQSDSEGGAYSLVHHLTELGHRRIAVISGGLSNSTSVDRVAGYKRALAEAWIRLDPDLVRFDGYNLEAGHRRTLGLLALKPRPTAIFAANNFIAYGSQRALREANLRVPDDISLVTFDDLPPEWHDDPFLTSIAQPACEIGRRSAELLMDRIEKRIPAKRQVITLTGQLIVGRPSAPPRSDPTASDARKSASASPGRLPQEVSGRGVAHLHPYSGGLTPLARPSGQVLPAQSASEARADTRLRTQPIIAGVSNQSGFTISRGINVSHWLSQDFGWSPRGDFLRRDDLSTLARLGFDHVRLPIDEKELWLPDGEPNEAEFDRLLEGIDWCLASGLRVIVDLHTLQTHHFNAANEGGRNTIWTDAAAQSRFLDLWRELSARLGHLPPSEVAYEFLNEPVADDDEDWNALVSKAYRLLRELEPGRVCVIGPNHFQQPEFMRTLRVPADDPNIILSVHNCAPLMLTHYRADWTSFPAFTGAVRYPGPAVVDPSQWAALRADGSPKLLEETADAMEDWGPERLQRLFAPAIDRAGELGLQLYCGEFGCLPTVDRDERLAYYRDITAVMAAAGVAWAAWEWKGDFGIHTWQGPSKLGTPIDRELVDVLVSR